MIFCAEESITDLIGRMHSRRSDWLSQLFFSFISPAWHLQFLLGLFRMKLQMGRLGLWNFSSGVVLLAW
jgi:hypothetical protein